MKSNSVISLKIANIMIIEVQGYRIDTSNILSISPMADVKSTDVDQINHPRFTIKFINGLEQKFYGESVWQVAVRLGTYIDTTAAIIASSSNLESLNQWRQISLNGCQNAIEQITKYWSENQSTIPKIDF